MELREKVTEMLSGRRCAVLGLGISNRPLCGFCSITALLLRCVTKSRRLSSRGLTRSRRAA